MKILVAAPYMFIKGHKHGSRNQSGLAYMIRDIVDMLVNEGHEISVLTQSIFTSEFKINNCTILSKRFINILQNINIVYLSYAFRICKNLKASLAFKMRVVMYFITGSYAEEIMKKIKPDMVHIHSIGLYTLPFVLACARTNTNCILTLHGLISFTESLNTNSFEEFLEKEFLNLAKANRFRITVISSGIKRRIENWQQEGSDYISIVTNSLKYCNINHDVNKEKNKIILCVGHLTSRKNHIQAVRAFELLKNRIDEGYRLILVGDGRERKEIADYINKNSLTQVILLGRIEKEEVFNLYSQASLLVMPSLDEGFGLPVIEAYSCGVPAVAFSDLDAIPELYNKDTMVLICERSDQALAEGIDKALSIDWDLGKIIAYSKYFSPQKIGKQYTNVLCTYRNNQISISDLNGMIEKILKR